MLRSTDKGPAMGRLPFQGDLPNVYKGLNHSELFPNRKRLEGLITEGEGQSGGGRG
jgi:hypothetical protein